MLARRMNMISEIKLKPSSCCARLKMSPLVFQIDECSATWGNAQVSGVFARQWIRVCLLGESTPFLSLWLSEGKKKKKKNQTNFLVEWLVHWLVPRAQRNWSGFSSVRQSIWMKRTVPRLPRLPPLLSEWGDDSRWPVECDATRLISHSQPG